MNILKDFWIILNRLHLFSHHQILRPSPWLSARLAHDITHKNVKPDLWRCCWKPAVCPPTSPLAQSSYRQNVKSSDWSMFQWYLKSFKQILMILVYWDYLCKDNRDMKFSYHPVFNHNGCTLTSISTAFAAICHIPCDIFIVFYFPSVFWNILGFCYRHQQKSQRVKVPIWLQWKWIWKQRLNFGGRRYENLYSSKH